MTDPLVVCQVLPGWQLPRPDGSTARSGDRVLLPPATARRWHERGALDILDPDDESAVTEP